MMTEQNIILRWNGLNPLAGSVESWAIRGIRPDGSFYGEIKVKKEDTYNLIKMGRKLPSRENKEVRMLVSELNECDPQDRLGNYNYEGIIGLGQVAHPNVILKYSRTRHEGTEMK